MTFSTIESNSPELNKKTHQKLDQEHCSGKIWTVKSTAVVAIHMSQIGSDNSLIVSREQHTVLISQSVLGLMPWSLLWLKILSYREIEGPEYISLEKRKVREYLYPRTQTHTLSVYGYKYSLTFLFSRLIFTGLQSLCRTEFSLCVCVSVFVSYSYCIILYCIVSYYHIWGGVTQQKARRTCSLSSRDGIMVLSYRQIPSEC